jgi:hypothetical protein
MPGRAREVNVPDPARDQHLEAEQRHTLGPVTPRRLGIRGLDLVTPDGPRQRGQPRARRGDLRRGGPRRDTVLVLRRRRAGADARPGNGEQIAVGKELPGPGRFAGARRGHGRHPRDQRTAGSQRRLARRGQRGRVEQARDRGRHGTLRRLGRGHDGARRRWAHAGWLWRSRRLCGRRLPHDLDGHGGARCEMGRGPERADDADADGMQRERDEQPPAAPALEHRDGAAHERHLQPRQSMWISGRRDGAGVVAGCRGGLAPDGLATSSGSACPTW